MSQLTETVINSGIWKACFNSDNSSSDLDRLKTSFIIFRDRASQLASEIRADLPDLTIHDISHLDSLWESASQIVGSNYPLTPTEVFVLGGAILLHDLAMSLAASPGGLDELKKTQIWIDTTHSKFKARLNREPSHLEVENPPDNIFKEVVFEILRKTHAQNAEKLATAAFKYKKEDTHLIEDIELRLSYGGIIGEIAHSHWWSISEVESRFTEMIGSPPWATASDWTVSPLKIACILRAADAAHLDARRAPIFTRSFRKLNPISQQHWDFQEKLLKPYLKDDALILTSGQSFPFSEAASWWICLDNLKMVDNELRGIDALLSDQSLPRFSAKRVAGVDNPDRLAKYIRTEKWHPINATVQISDIPSIIKSIGGQELYGADPTVPIRELIQNSCDAIRARRIYEDRNEEFGEVTITLTESNGDHYLVVQDNGTGMSKHVVTNYLLDFGKSFWNSASVQEEFPGLASSHFYSTGKYGIGFFSSFMISNEIKIVTRHVDKAKSETMVIEFGSGLYGRPIIRPAEPEEYIRDGGTSISLKLSIPPYEKGGILHRSKHHSEWTLDEVCTNLAPAIDVSLSATHNNKKTKIITANDWQRIPSDKLFERLENIGKIRRVSADRDYDTSPHRNVRDIYDSDGTIVGRGCITTSTHSHLSIPGVLVVGGLVSNYLYGISGILTGHPLRASRDISDISIPDSSLAAWATEQADLIKNTYKEPSDQAECAAYICACGGDPCDLPVGLVNGKWLSISQLSTLSPYEELLIVEHYDLYNATRNTEELELFENILYIDLSNSYMLSSPFKTSADSNFFDKNSMNFVKSVLTSIATAWEVSPNELLAQYEDNDRDEIKIGTTPNGELYCEGMVLKNPNIASTKPIITPN